MLHMAHTIAVGVLLKVHAGQIHPLSFLSLPPLPPLAGGAEALGGGLLKERAAGRW